MRDPTAAVNPERESPAEGTTLSGAWLGGQNGEGRSLPSIEPEQGHETKRAILPHRGSLSVRFATLEHGYSTFSDAFGLSDGKGLPHPQARIGQPPFGPMERRGLRRAREWSSCRPHLQGQCSAGRIAVDVDVDVPAPYRLHTSARLR
jgi:hypothetical protein